VYGAKGPVILYIQAAGSGHTPINSRGRSEVIVVDENIFDTVDIEIQKQINRSLLIIVGYLFERGLSFGRNRIGSILKGHRHKFIIENKLNTTSEYGLQKDTEFKVLMQSIDRLVEHGYVEEKKPDFKNKKYRDKAGNVMYLTNKGKAKLNIILKCNSKCNG
jgi:superfamily II DNA helicase RecQ